ncbi:MAG: MarR family transcriptional regulator [Caldimonas sp.]
MDDDEIRRLAAFRLLLRQFESFTEQAAQACGLTSLQYQALLAIKAHEADGAATVTALAQSLLVKHNSAVGLVDRMEQLGLVSRGHPEGDRRSVVVQLTPRGRRIVYQLASQYRSELHRMAPEIGRNARRFAQAPEA